MYDSILVPLDGSRVAEQVLPYVCRLAQGLDCRIILLQMVEPPRQHRPAEIKALFEELAGSVQAQAQAYLDSVVAKLQQGGIAASCEVLIGHAAEGIASYAETHRPGLIAMATHGHSGITRWMMGSVTDRVISVTPTPSLVVRAQADPPRSLQAASLDAVIVPLDGSPLAEAALPHAKALAKQLNLELILVRVVRPLALILTPEETVAGLPDVATAMEEAARDYLTGKARSLERTGLRVRWSVPYGLPAEEIIALAQQTPQSLVVMATHGRSGVGRWVLGSVADRVVQACGEPVLLVHPRSP